MFPFAEHIPTVTTEQMIEVDRAMIEDFGIELIQMMENAGRNLAALVQHRFTSETNTQKTVTVLAGVGGNGGGGLVCARHLHNRGIFVQVILARADGRFAPIPRHQLDILRRMDVRIFSADQTGESASPDLIIDALIGYSLKGAPRGAAADLIRWANRQSRPILALDIPSGLDASSGKAYDPAIRATATLTLALPKKGLLQPAAPTGELYLADISVPRELYSRMGIEIGPIFSQSEILRLR